MTDCWIFGSGTCLHAIHYQCIGILSRWCQRGFCSRLHFTLDGHGEQISQVLDNSMLMPGLDRMDILFRLYTPSYTPKLHKFLRPPQRTARLDTQQQTYKPTLRQRTRNDPHRQPRTTNVHFCSAQRLRDFIACIRLPRGSGRPTSSTALWTSWQVRFTSRPNTNSSSSNGRHW